MTSPNLPAPAALNLAKRRAILLPLVAVTVQSIAALYFIIDGVDDTLRQIGHGMNGEILMECLVALALLLAVVLGAQQLRRALADAQRHEAALQVAHGAMGELLALRFAEWALSPSEADVALFALKGCTPGEIAAMRQTAEGTVRSQLSQVYAKAGVTSQPMLIAHFIEELV